MKNTKHLHIWPAIDFIKLLNKLKPRDPLDKPLSMSSVEQFCNRVYKGTR